MWMLEINFENEESIIFRGDEQDIPLTIAIRYYNLFVKEAGGTAVYRRKKDENPVPLDKKILQIVGNN